MKAAWSFVVILVAGNAAAAKLPSYFKVCKLSDPEYDACVISSVEALRPRLAKGIPRLHIPPLEPLVLPEISVDRDLDTLSLRLRITDLRIYGGSHFRIETLKVDLATASATVSLLLPAVSEDGNYEMDGHLLEVPVRGGGTFTANFTNIRCDLSGRGATVATEDGVKRPAVVELTAGIRVLGEADVKLVNREGAASINSGITDAASNFLNENRKQVYAVVYPILNDVYLRALKALLDPVLGNLEAEELLPS